MLGKKIVSKMLEVWGSIVVNGESITGDKINTWDSALQEVIIPEYADDTAADNDTELSSGAPYSTITDRTVKRKP